MKYDTKKKRLLAIFDTYQSAFKKTDGVTMDEVSGWAYASGLIPVPKRGDPEEACLDWERRLLAACPNSI